jgi:hypothetical protein
MIATDPLSLVFLGCMLFSAVFLLVSALSGMGHAQVGHVAHVGHIGHVGHVGGASHIAHVAHAGGGHVPAGHAAQAGHAGSSTHTAAANGQPGAAAPPASPWSTITSTLLASLNVFSVLTFVFFFGLLGYLLHSLNVVATLAILLPIIFGAVGAIAVGSALGRLFGEETGVLTQEDSRLEGRIGQVSMPIRPGGVGEAIIQNANGGHQSIGARSLDGTAIPVDTDIVVVNVRDGIADVQTWEGFMRSVRSGEMPELPPLPASPAAPDHQP